MSVDQLTIDELNEVSGGRTKLPKPDIAKAWKIAQIQRDNPKF